MNFLLALVIMFNGAAVTPIPEHECHSHSTTVECCVDDLTHDTDFTEHTLSEKNVKEEIAYRVKEIQWTDADNRYQAPQITESTTFDAYFKGYFRALVNNIGYNAKGSCSYVAIGMLLSYYDSFLNDNIIPEAYDVVSEAPKDGEGNFLEDGKNNILERMDSPGVMFDNLEKIDLTAISGYVAPDSTLPEYKQYLHNISYLEDISLHAKLIRIGTNLGYNTYTNADVNNGNYEPTLLPGINADETYEVLLNYLYTNSTTKNKYTITRKNTGTSAEIATYIKQQIDAGKPVLTGIKSAEFGLGHTVICYDYDDNYIYANMGWDKGLTSFVYYPIGSGYLYDTFTYALTLDFSLSHTCAKNYEVWYDTLNTVNRYCYCDCTIMTYKPLHAYNAYHMEYTAEGHVLYCVNACGNKKIIPHSYVIDDYTTQYTDEGHIIYCGCGQYYIVTPHTLSGNEYMYNGNHYDYCIDCRREVFIPHVYNYAYTEDGYEYYYCECGKNYRVYIGP